MQLALAIPGAIGFDTDTPLDATTAAGFVAAGYHFVCRYVSRDAPEPGDLTSTEVGIILAAGLALMVVQHAPEPDWTPSAALGKVWGEAAVSNLRALSLPPGVMIWKDHEGVATGSSSSDVAAHVNAWSAALAGAAEPGLYVGYDCGLNAQQLYYDLTLSRYWKSLSNVPAPALRGFCMEQTVGGTTFDIDVVASDAHGGVPTWLIP